MNELAEEISYPLTKKIQASLESGRLPKDWLTANVSPIHKGGQRLDPKNVQPVSLPSTCSYVMERITNFALTQFAVSQQLMNKRPHGFLHGRSCLANLLNASEQWTRSLDKNSGVDVIYFDFKEAFDFAPHLRMLHKLNKLGICSRLHSWILATLPKGRFELKLERSTPSA